ncbi:hypothetical protein HPP92_008593 [Vanilla planifolia]|uniref:Uncharacterized protein n=1 Tax=Vanilla planifolia TaxID=51239 RepID=A0A835RHM2_VANPL|nr:hypothetical protein HPP92_008593 [Vanilla planifolia]
MIKWWGGARSAHVESPLVDVDSSSPRRPAIVVFVFSFLLAKITYRSRQAFWFDFQGNFHATLRGLALLYLRIWCMEIKPVVALRAIFVGGLAAFAKLAGAMKAAGGVKVGAAAAAMTAAATAAVSGSKNEKEK